MSPKSYTFYIITQMVSFKSSSVAGECRLMGVYLPNMFKALARKKQKNNSAHVPSCRIKPDCLASSGPISVPMLYL